MEITLEMILYFLHHLNPEIVRINGKEHRFIGVQQLYRGSIPERQPGEDSPAEHAEYLYIGALSAVLEMQEMLRTDMTVLAIRDLEYRKEVLTGLPCSLILVEGTFEPAYLLNDMINTFRFLANWDKQMHIAALEGKSIQELLDISEDMLKYPMIIFDAGFDVLAYTRHISSEYANFRGTIRAGYTEARTMDLIKEQKIFSRLKAGEALVAPAVEDETRTNIYLAFYGNRNVLGYACVFLDEYKPEQGYLDLLQMFVENLIFCLKREYENQRIGQMMYETFLLNLMNPAGNSVQQVKEQIKNIDGISEHGRFVLGVFSFEGNKVPLTFLARRMAQEMWDVKPFIYENQICLLRTLKEGAPKGKPLGPWEKRNIEKLLQDYNYVFGVSHEFSDIMDLQYAFRQTQAAMKFGRASGQRFCCYQDYYYYDLFDVMEQHMPVECLKGALYKELQAFDREHRTKYCAMILTWLECDCNATHAAERMYLHRNTIRKAVQFVEETWQVSLDDTEVKKRMVISELVDRYLALKKKMS